MIGKRISLFWDKDQVEGIILDSFMGIEYITVEIPSGLGGSVAVKNPIVSTKYLVLLDNKVIIDISPTQIKEVL